MKSLRARDKIDGFTIVELMIAMAVLSVVLVVVSVAMMSIGNLYSKGIKQAKMQNAVRSISDDLASHLQLMSGNSGTGPYSTIIVAGSLTYTRKIICAADTRYTYVTGIQQGTESTPGNPQIPHVLWRDKLSGGCTANPPKLHQNDPGTDGVELVPNSARLTELSIAEVNGTYAVAVGVAYGEKDLFVDEVVLGTGVRCKGDTGTKFCATAYLKTNVARRL